MNPRMSASVGIVTYPTHGDTSETLMQHADIALYLAKEHRNACAVYDYTRDPYNPARLALASDLDRAVATDEFELHYQRKLDTRTLQPISVEALLRWQHPQRGLLYPAEFIALAEHTGLIKQLTLLVLRKAICQAREWQEEGHARPVSVNLSAANLLDTDLVRDITSILDDEGVNASQLGLEITETTIMTDPEQALTTLRELDAMGIRLSIDDFGTGYSSLAYLRRLPVHEIKIDQSFVRHLATNDADAKIVHSTIDLAHSLGFSVVAEGVEDQHALELLASVRLRPSPGLPPLPTSASHPCQPDTPKDHRPASTTPPPRPIRLTFCAASGAGSCCSRAPSPLADRPRRRRSCDHRVERLPAARGAALILPTMRASSRRIECVPQRRRRSADDVRTDSESRGARMINLRSRAWFDNPANLDMTALYLERTMNYGLTRDELQSGRPIIGIAQSGSDITPCNRHHLALASRVRDGIREAGGVPFEFPVHPIQETCKRPTAALDRNLQYLSLVEILYGYPIDGVVLTTGCDKTTPAQLMAAASVDIPAIVFSGGPMLNGWLNGERMGSGTIIWRAREMLARGDIGESEFTALIASSAPSAGHCNTMGTALTMNSLAEALGMSLPGCAAIPAPHRDRQEMGYRTGKTHRRDGQ